MPSRDLFSFPDILVDSGVAPALIKDVDPSTVCNSDASYAWPSDFHGNFADGGVLVVKVGYFGKVAVKLGLIGKRES